MSEAQALLVPFSAQDMGDYLGQEPDAYVEKPVDPQALQDAVRDLLIG